MNQNDQMRDLAQKIVDCVDARAIKDWDCLHMYLSEAAQMARQALAEPAPLVRLTDEEVESEYCKADAYLMMTDHYEFGLVANAIMAAMIEKNKGKI